MDRPSRPDIQVNTRHFLKRNVTHATPQPWITFGRTDMPFFGSYIPMEYFMVAGLGFCVAWLMAFMCFPAVHNRAQRLAHKQYDQEPLSLREMQAEKDQIRAGFAAATRGLEVSIDKLKTKTAAHATDIAKKVQLIERLRKELGELDEALNQGAEREREARSELLDARRDLEEVNSALAEATERERLLRADLRETRRELAMKDGALDAAEQEVAAIKTEIARLAPLLQAMPLARAAEVVPLAPHGAHASGYDGTPLKKPLSNQGLRAAFAPAMKPAG